MTGDGTPRIWSALELSPEVVTWCAAVGARDLSLAR